MTIIQKSNTATKIAIVTGGSRGIGRRIAERLAQEGNIVVIGYRSASNEADAVIAGIEQAGGVARAVRVDVANEDEVAELFDTTEREFGGVDVVVHAAGMMITRPLQEFPAKEIDAVIRTNLFGAFLVNRQARSE